MSRHITHFRRTALGATAAFACTALDACGGDDGNAGPSLRRGWDGEYRRFDPRWRRRVRTLCAIAGWGTADIVKNLRLRQIRTVPAGQSLVVSIDPDSSLAYDAKDWVRLDWV